VDLLYQYASTNTGAGFIKSNWVTVEGATSYKIKITSGPTITLVDWTNIGNVTSTSTAISGHALAGAWLTPAVTYYVHITPVNADGDGPVGTSNGVQIAEKEIWDGVSVSGIRNETSGGYYTAMWSGGPALNTFYGNHFFETINILANTTCYVQGFGRVESVPAGISSADSKVTNPKDGWLGIHANNITVSGYITASGRGYGGGGGGGQAYQSGTGYGGVGGSNGLGGAGGDGASTGGGGGSPGGSGGTGAGVAGNGFGGGAGNIFGGGGGGARQGSGGAGGAAGSGTGTYFGNGAAGSVSNFSGVGNNYRRIGNANGGAGELMIGGGGGGAGDTTATAYPGGGGGGGYGAGGGGAAYGTSGGTGGGGGGGSGGSTGSNGTPTSAGAGATGCGAYAGGGGAANNTPPGNGGDAIVGGYRSAAGNGDSTTGKELYLGSGGGGGGGAGKSSDGLGAAGAGAGGASGSGFIRLVAYSTITVNSSAWLLANGMAGGGGGDPHEPTSTYGGYGGRGGTGAGGAVLLDGKWITNNATGVNFSARGGNNQTSNGGTIKVFAVNTFAGSDPTAGNYGRLYKNVLPSTSTVRDGAGADINFSTITSCLQANWDAAAIRTAGRTLNRYEFKIGHTPFGNEVLGWTSAGTATSTTSYRTLNYGRRYFVSVRAFDDTGFAGEEATSNGVLIVDTSSPTVTISSFSALSQTQIKIYFTATDEGSGLADTNPYFVEISPNADMGGANNSGWISQTDHTFSSLKRNGRYYFRVKAKDKADNIGTSTITDWRAKPGTHQENMTVRTGANAFGFVGDALWDWDVPVKSGSALIITAYIRYNTEYGGSATKPKLTLSGVGISPTSISATGTAENAWELLTINAGTPSQNATLTLRAEGFSTSPGAKFYIDDINVSQ
jgi:hypothetical protein